MNTVEQVKQESPLLGRNLNHDERSRSFPMTAAETVTRSDWRDKRVRLYAPLPNPNQPVGCCTGVAKASQFNAVGNRRKGRVLDMDDALEIYSKASQLDPWAGSWPPEDTGSSGLASAKAAQQLGLGGTYRWLFGGADEVVSTIMLGEVVSVGSWWHADMMYLPKDKVIRPTGGRVGGHQYVARGYDKSKDLVLCRNWWGPDFRDFWLARTDLDHLLRDQGDAHVQYVIP